MGLGVGCVGHSPSGRRRVEFTPQRHDPGPEDIGIVAICASHDANDAQHFIGHTNGDHIYLFDLFLRHVGIVA